MSIAISGILLALAAAAPAASLQSEQCTWESPGELRVTLVFHKDGERYLRETELTVEVLYEKGLLQRYAEGRRSHWVVRTREPDGTQITGNTYVSPPVVEPIKGASQHAPAPEFTTLAAKSVIKERLDWDDYLLPGARWRDDRTYIVRIVGSSPFVLPDDEHHYVRFDDKGQCARNNIKVVVGD